MNMRDLIPWGRQSSRTPALYGGEETSPLLSLHREMNRLFDNAFRGFDLAGFGPGRQMMSGPTLEVSETDHEIRITAELPGLEEKDVELLMEDGVLILRGEKKAEMEDKDRGYSERAYGRFERRIALPPNVDEQAAEASFRNGVLTIRLPKSAETNERARRIPISGEITKH